MSEVQPTPPPMAPVKSSNIAEVGHDGSALWVKFKGGGLYRYPSAGQEHLEELTKAPSPGGYFHSQVKRAHSGVRVP